MIASFDEKMATGTFSFSTLVLFLFFPLRLRHGFTIIYTPVVDNFHPALARRRGQSLCHWDIKYNYPVTQNFPFLSKIAQRFLTFLFVQPINQNGAKTMRAG